jgi:hypothetical protein
LGANQDQIESFLVPLEIEMPLFNMLVNPDYELPEKQLALAQMWFKHNLLEMAVSFLDS